jgi:2-oxoglutarate dehydrogenase E2 component (dihydrolipoamide succinyltransferase)
MPVDVTVPSVGESITEVFVAAWLKQPGDRVERDEPLLELETDKATVEVPSPTAGILTECLVAAGGSAQVGDVIARVTAADEAAAAPAPAPRPEAAPAAAGDVASTRVMPAAQAALATHLLRPDDVHASGPGGRLLKEDVLRHAAAMPAAAAPVAAPPPAASAPAIPAAAAPAAATPPLSAPSAARGEEVVPMTPLRRRIAERLVSAQQTAALLTTFNEIDMSAVIALRNAHKEAFQKKHGARLGFMSFFVKATIEALREFPQLNAEIRGDAIVFKNHYDIGVAVSTPKGLIVPVLRDADRMGFARIETAIADFGTRAQANRITPEELQGGTFTITNGGVFGSLMSTPIVNPPQSGVLGMHAIVERPIAVAGQVVIRPMMYVALTYDHRIVDGREAVTFLRRVKEAVEQPARILLEV